MQVVNITRVDNNTFESDMLVGKYSMDAKTKTLNYIYDYALANCNLDIDKELLDSNLDMNMFSLKNFVKANYDLDIKQDLIIQSVNATKDNCVFVKQYDKDTDEYPTIYQFNKDEIKKAKTYMAFLVNDSLINMLNNNNRLNEYEDRKLDLNSFEKMSYSYNNSNFEMNTLYNGGLFLEELLNNTCSLKQLKDSYNNNLNI